MQFPYDNLENTLLNAVAAIKWRATRNAPSSLAEAQAHYYTHNYVLVSSEHSQHTIFSTPWANWQSRAWHDHTHIHHGLEFDAAGEAEVCRIMLQEAKRFGADDITLRAIFADNEGQQIYSRFHAGEFPEDQRTFVEVFMLDPWLAVSSTF